LSKGGKLPDDVGVKDKATKEKKGGKSARPLVWNDIRIKESRTRKEKTQCGFGKREMESVLSSRRFQVFSRTTPDNTRGGTRARAS